MSMCHGTAGEFVLRPLFTCVALLSNAASSLHSTLFSSRGTGAGRIREGETAGAKATVLPEVRLGGR